MSSRTELMAQQRKWAESADLAPDERGYLERVADNLWKPLSPRTKSAFDKGSGSELQDSPSRPAKMKALHSSSALAVNFFDSWVDKDASALRQVLDLDYEIASIAFEAQYPTGLTGNPPNLDVALQLVNGNIIAIESKFSEWLTPKSRNKAPFKSKYFPEGKGLWQANNLTHSQELAASMSRGNTAFHYLDAAQLLKHALGLATQFGDQFSLYYAYYDWPGPESETHRGEIDHFANAVGSELRFRAISYQTLFVSLSNLDSVDKPYRQYLRDRYFSGAV